ncbi:hypothetical protein JHK84_043934 [Glycine max]|nr:hypothetical protein JHK84_043934 [Glycine max]
MVTAYDYPVVVHLDTIDVDICLVGDSMAMVVHSHDTTLPIMLEEMLFHYPEYMKYKDPKQSIDTCVKDLVSRMTLEEKIGQMLQIEQKYAFTDLV